MNQSEIINYESNQNCFAKTDRVISHFLYGENTIIQDPLFTVFIPTYKRVNLFKESLESVIRQWHVPFEWEILVVDNEPYDGIANETENYIRKIDNQRIRYYRNSENLRPGDNFNRGFLLARGKWVMMLHDDDILLDNSLQNMYKVINFLLNSTDKPLGAVSVKYHQFKYDPNNKKAHLQEIEQTRGFHLSQPTNYWLYKLTHNQVLFTGHIGGDVPSNGATYNRKAVLETGGFNDDFGISADLILYYCLENKYAVYSTMVPYGFYRWGINTMSKSESTYKTIEAGYNFRNYVYSKNFFNKVWGFWFKTSQHRRFMINVVSQKNSVINQKEDINSFCNICNKKPNKYIYVFYCIVIKYIYEKIKEYQVKKLYNKSLGYKDNF